MIINYFLFSANSDIFVVNATPYSPFESEKTPKNLGYLGRGYDVLYGNPLDESGRVDPGKFILVPILEPFVILVPRPHSLRAKSWALENPTDQKPDSLTRSSKHMLSVSVAD